MKLAFTVHEVMKVYRDACDRVDGQLSVNQFTDALNARLAEMLAEAPVMYGNLPLDNDWSNEQLAADTHRARLVQIGPLVVDKGA